LFDFLAFLHLIINFILLKIAVYSAHDFEVPFLKTANANKNKLQFISEKLNGKSVKRSKGCEAIAVFSSDDVSKEIVNELSEYGIKFITTRSAGFNHIDLKTAAQHGISVTNVPGYSPNAIAEHCIALLLAISRKLIPSYERIRNYDFSLNGLVGSELSTKTIGIMGTGNIGYRLTRILLGFGCKILAYDAKQNVDLAELDGVKYVELKTLLSQSDIISLNLPLNNKTEHIINADSIKQMKEGVILINAGRGKLIDTKSVVDALKSEKIGGFGMDVYEREEGFFYENHSNEVFKDDLFARLLTFKNVVITAHQAFLTETALQEIAETTMQNIDAFENGNTLKNEVKHTNES
jgi:D-lactate dehydrogenase